MRLDALIEAARDLAWMPVANTCRRRAYDARMDAHQRLLDALRAAAPLEDDLSPTGYLMRAIRRAAAASYSNRYGPPYYERREAIYQLRGALIVWMQAVAA